MNKKAFESRLNVLVAHLLSERLGLRAISEYISSRRRADVAIFVNGVKVALEGSYSKSDAERDVQDKVDRGLADLGIALHYREEYPQNLTDAELEDVLKKSIFGIRLVVPRDVSNTLIAYLENRKISPEWVTGWMNASISDLASILNESIQFILREEDIERCVTEIENEINSFVSSLSHMDINKKIANRLYEILYKLYGLSVGDYKEIDELLYAQAALSLLLSSTFYQSVRMVTGLDDIDTYIRRYGARLGLKKAFEDILRIDWQRIYEVALAVVNVLPDALESALRKIVELAMKISSMRALLRRDFTGKIYHKVVGDWSVRKGFATYFTTVPAAYLLAYLTAFTKTGVFKDGFVRVKIGDLTCGSGTLLTAMYTALKDLYLKSALEKDEDVNLEVFHKNMLEEDLWGMDALRYAVQIASINLAFQDPTTTINKMNTFCVPLGKENERVILGSLEFLLGTSIPSIAFAGEEYHPFIEGAKPAAITEVEKIPSEIPTFDIIIMNPPFTRPTGRGGKPRGGLFGFIVDERVRESVIKRYKSFRENSRNELRHIVLRYFPTTILKRMGIEKEIFDIGQAGEGLLFLHLASKRIKSDGKIAFVLPKSLLTGVSWLPARCLLFDKFSIEHIIVSYDANKGYNFSESTSLSETLIIARRKRENEEVSDSETTKITALVCKPSTSLEARALAFNVLKVSNSEYIKINDAVAYVRTVSRKKLKERLYNWGTLVAFPSPRLIEIADEILSGDLLGVKIPLVKLGEIAQIGIDRHQFHEAFIKVEGRLPESYPAVYGGEEERRLRMFTTANARILPKQIRTKRGEIKYPGHELFRRFSSNLLIPDRIWVDTAHVIALYCDEPVLSNIFYALRFRSSTEGDHNRLKALCLWLNTTWGLLTILANRSETRGRWINLKMTHWKLQPVLDVTRLSKDILEKLAKVFDKNCHRSLRRLPEQFNPDNVDPVRLEIDQGFLNSLDIEVKYEEIKELYKLIHENLALWAGET